MRPLYAFFFGAVFGAVVVAFFVPRSWLPAGYFSAETSPHPTAQRAPRPVPPVDYEVTPEAIPPSEPVPKSVPKVDPTGEAPSEPSPEAGLAPTEPLGDGLLIPVAGVSAAQLHDTFTESRSAGRVHEAIDIASPTGTPVYAVNDGKIVKLFDSKPGGLTIYHFDPSETYAYYYAHLDHYAPGLTEGKQVVKGEVIGFVGSTGNANPAAPHLHFAIFKLAPEKNWWQGSPVNPYPWLAGN